MMLFDDLNDDEWAVIDALFHTRTEPHGRRGRPCTETRTVVNAVVWVLTFGAAWSSLPKHYPSPPTCRRRFEQWRVDGTLDKMIRRLDTAGRPIPLEARRLAAVVQPGHARMRGVFWANPESWHAPADSGTGRQYTAGHLRRGVRGN